MILAQSHNPSIINHDFLRNNEIVGPEWNPSAHSIITPIVTQINYGKDIILQVTPDKCIIDEKIGTKSHDSLSLYEFVKKYVEVLKHIPYTALGINWQVSHALSTDPHEWLKSKFLQNGDLRKKISTAELTFKLQSIDSSICTLSVRASDIQSNNLVTVHCNFHFDLEEETNKVEGIIKILVKWMNYKKKLEDYLDKYIIQEENMI